jgi:hypothetical protein
MRSYGPRVDPETGALHKRVSQAHEYQVASLLWRRPVGNGIVTCELLRSITGPAKRIVQLRADYTDAGTVTTDVIQLAGEDDEQLQVMLLTVKILEASRRPDPGASPGDPG